MSDLRSASRLIGAVLLSILSIGLGPQAAAAGPQSPRDVLDIVPSDCWGLVVAANLEAVDARLTELLGALELPALGPAELFRSRLNLGPNIPTAGPLAIAVLPAPTLEEFGQSTVLIVPCSDVEGWLQAFTTAKLEERLWRSELVWGPTFVASLNGFAVLATSEQTARAMLNSGQPLSRRAQGPRLDSLEPSACCLWLNLAALYDSPAGLAWRGAGGEARADSNFGSSLLNSPSELTAQIDTVQLNMTPSALGLRLTAAVAARQGSPLASLMTLAQSEPAADVQRLPALPAIGAVSGRLAAGQTGGLAGEVDKLLASPAIASATHQEQLTRLRSLVAGATGEVRAARCSLAVLPPDPEGLLCVLALLDVPNAAAWIERIGQACAILDGQLFRDPALNTVYRSVRFEPQSDVIDAAPIAELELQLPPTEPTDGSAEGISYGGALGSQRMIVRLAAVDSETVALCIGGHPHEMGRLIAAARGREAGLAASPGIAAACAQLPPGGAALVVFSPEELIHLSRTLARIQNKVGQAPARLPPSGAVCAARLSHTHPFLAVEAVVPTDVLKAMKALLIRQSVPDMQLMPEG